MNQTREYIVRCHTRFDSEHPAVHCQFPVTGSSFAQVESETKRVMRVTHGVDPLNLVIDSIIEFTPCGAWR